MRLQVYKVNSRGFAHRPDVGYERKKGVKTNLKFVMCESTMMRVQFEGLEF